MSKNSKNTISPLYLILSCFFITSLLISNIIAGKMASFFGITLPAAVVLFPLTYIFGDVLTEVYGFKKARLTIWIGLFANLFMVLIFTLTLALPYPDFWVNQEAYKTVLGMTPRLVLASLVAYFAGEFLNSVVLSRLKVRTKGRMLWVRTIGSTIVGEEILVTPLTYLLVGWLKKKEQMDVFDHDVKYNPFSLDWRRDHE